MYDSLTDRVRLAVALADTSAKDRRASRVGPEHILHGLLLEASGEAARVMRRLGIDPGVLRTEVEATLGAVPALPLSQEGLFVMTRAHSAMESLGETSLGTASLLLGLLDEEGTLAQRVLAEAGLTPEVARREILALRRDRAPDVDGAKAPGLRILCTAELGLTGLSDLLSLRSREETLDELGRRLIDLHEDTLTSYLTIVAGEEVTREHVEVRFTEPAAPPESDPLPGDSRVLDAPGVKSIGLRWTVATRVAAR